MKIKKLADGLWPVMLTPFKENGAIDYSALLELVDFYLEKGASGLFANCLSSEMYHLTEAERHELLTTIVNHVKGVVPIVATGNFGTSMDEQIESIIKINDLGVNAVVIVNSLLVSSPEEESAMVDKFYAILDGTSNIPLGIYECPEPFKILMPPDLLSELAKTGRFLYFKDTSCDTNQMITKIKSIQGSSLNLYNANTPTVLESLYAGASGVSPISANFYPELYVKIYQLYKSGENRENLQELQEKLTLMDAVTRINYPMGAKVFLGMRGLKIKPKTRIKANKLNYEEQLMLKTLFTYLEKIS